MINIGDKVGRLTLIKEVKRLRLPSGQTNRAFLCRCECGNEKVVRLVHLSNGKIRSCGCLHNRESDKDGSYLRKRWRAIIYRCSENYFESHLYFYKGIRVCDEWIDYNSFKVWALNNGYKKELQIDRIDNSKGYSPDNCRWVTREANVNNRDITFYVVYNGNKEPIKTILKRKGLEDHYNAIRHRILRGWSHDKAINTPIRKGNYYRSPQ